MLEWFRCTCCDLTDYNIRYMGTYNINVSSSTATYTVTVPNMKTTGWFVHYAPASDNFNDWSAFCNNGSFTAIYLRQFPTCWNSCL